MGCIFCVWVRWCGVRVVGEILERGLGWWVACLELRKFRRIGGEIGFVLVVLSVGVDG